MGSDITPSGAQVVSGYFYADPADFAYGSIYNPEVFVKVYIDPSGWTNIAFNHVTVDDVYISSSHGYNGSPDEMDTVSLSHRLAEHQYDGVKIDASLAAANFNSPYRSVYYPTSINALSTADGYTLSSQLWANAILQVTGNPVTLVWKEVGADTTPSGDRVVSGYFYADPDDFAYGSAYNPEIFVKVYIASNGWTNMAFNHVTVDGVSVDTAHQYTGTPSQSGNVTLDGRLLEHQYTGVTISEDSDGQETGNRLFVNPEDSRFLYHEAGDGSKVTVFGTKDADGIPIEAEMITLEAADETTTSFYLDAASNIEKLVLATGEAFEFSDNGDGTYHLIIKSPDGTMLYETDLDVSPQEASSLDSLVVEPSVVARETNRVAPLASGGAAINFKVNVYKTCANQNLDVDTIVPPHLIISSPRKTLYTIHQAKGEYYAKIPSPVATKEQEKMLDWCDAARKRLSAINGATLGLGMPTSLKGMIEGLGALKAAALIGPQALLAAGAWTVLSATIDVLTKTQICDWYYDLGGPFGGFLNKEISVSAYAMYNGKLYHSQSTTITPNDFKSLSQIDRTFNIPIPLDEREACFVDQSWRLNVKWENWGSYGACDISFNCDGTMKTDGCLTGIDSETGKWTLLKNGENGAWHVLWAWDAYDNVYYQAPVYHASSCTVVLGTMHNLTATSSKDEGEWYLDMP